MDGCPCVVDNASYDVKKADALDDKMKVLFDTGSMPWFHFYLGFTVLNYLSFLLMWYNCRWMAALLLLMMQAVTRRRLMR